MTTYEALKTSLRDFWWRYKKNRAATVGLIILILQFSMAIFAPYIAPHNPWKINKDLMMSSPSWSNPMGTDFLGRDILSGVIYGTRISVIVGLLAAATSIAIGTIIGTVSGYYGGLVDDVLMRLTEYTMTLPRLFLTLILVALYGPQLLNIILILGVTTWPSTARLVRAQVYSIKEKEFIEASIALGCSVWDVIFTEILPNVVPIIIVNGSLEIAHSVLLESGIAFLGMGDPSVISWGRMIDNGRMYIRQGWWITFFPGLALFIMILALNLVGDGLNDALNPKLKER